MKDSESEKDDSQKNDKLLSEFAVTKRQSRSLYRNWAVTSKKSVGSRTHSQANVFTRISTSSIGNDYVDSGRVSISESTGTLIEDRADEIVRHIEKTRMLMDDNPKSNNDRISSLREMTEYLTLKRSVKRKLTKSICSAHNTLSYTARLKYRISIFFYKREMLWCRCSCWLAICSTSIIHTANFFAKNFIPLIKETTFSHDFKFAVLQIPVAIKHFTNNFELWYSSLKVIEGHFGSNVASYFKFLRKLFLLNACIFILMFFFVMVPQLLFRLFQYVDDNQLSNSSSEFNYTKKSGYPFLEEAKAEPLVMVKDNPYKENGEFRLGNLFTGEGFLTNTILFYGYYTNTSLQLFKGHSYNIPAAYFFTSTVCYSIIFFFLFTSVAVSYRKRYIEASGGMHNTFTNKIFCGWDFGIATRQAAELKSKSIYIEIKELLDDLSKQTKKKTCISSFYTTVISLSLNALLLFLLIIGGMYSWKYLDQQMIKADTATTMMTWLILTLVVAIAPVLFSFIAHLEGFESPSSALYMTLIRTFILYAIVIAVVVAFRLNRASESECWETVLGQDMFRLVVLDFIFGSIGTALSEFIRYRIYITMWSGIGCPEFDIARSTMNLIYNQTLFYVGLFFSPVLSLLITIKLGIIFYVKKWGAIHNCKPFVRPWKASQAHTVYLSIAFFAFFCVLMAYGYIITSVRTSNCGPFRGETLMYEKLLEEILANKNSKILMAFYYITRPGVVGIVLMSMVLGVYYMRAVAMARIHVVKHLQHLLRLKAEDRKILLNEISKYTKGEDKGDFRGFTAFRSNSCRSLATEKHDVNIREKNFAGVQLKKGKLSFSSLDNVKYEKEGNQRNIFNSMQDFSHNSNFLDSVEIHYKFNEDQNYQNENFEEDPIQDSNEEKLSETKAPILTSNAPCSTELSDEEPSCSHYDGNHKLNFNPVFTESEFFISDDEEGTPPVVRTENLTKRSSEKQEEEMYIADQQEEMHMADQQEDSAPGPSLSRNYLDFQERMPSRIGFPDDRKKRN